jgi:hypothetical protein
MKISRGAQTDEEKANVDGARMDEEMETADDV